MFSQRQANIKILSNVARFTNVAYDVLGGGLLLNPSIKAPMLQIPFKIVFQYKESRVFNRNKRDLFSNSALIKSFVVCHF